jgi:hypothetical protein
MIEDIHDTIQRAILFRAGIQTECKSNVLPLMNKIQLVFQLTALPLTS